MIKTQVKQNNLDRVMDARLVEARNNIQPRIPWWLNPFWFSICLLLPFVLAVSCLIGPQLARLGEPNNYLSIGNILLACLSISCIALGSLLSALSRRKPRSNKVITSYSLNQTILTMSVVVAFCYTYIVANVATHPAIILSMLHGSSSAMYQLKEAQGLVGGITSFTNIKLPLFSLYGYMMSTYERNRLWKINKYMFPYLIVLVIIQSFAGSERMSIVYTAVSFIIPCIFISLCKKKFISAFPVVAFMLIVGLFSLGEYFRTWQVYKSSYGSFWEYISVRFLGYFATSLNNGAGFYSMHQTYGYPNITADGLYRMANIIGIKMNMHSDYEFYLQYNANPEYNNPCGLFAPFSDYGILVGSLLFIAIGIVSSFLYVSILRGKPLGVVLYPIFYLALLDVVRIFLYGDSHFIPALVAGVVCCFFLKTRERVEINTERR